MMFRKFVRARIVNATVTHSSLEATAALETVFGRASLNLVHGPVLFVDRDLLRRADLLPFEQVNVSNRDNGAHFRTMVAEAPEGSGVVAVIGGACFLAREGASIDLVSTVSLSPDELATFRPRVLVLGAKNQIAMN